ncbi:hypothetical protein [Dethiobacter alkaliphilus]|uniref:Uncharacterized protein n=1 Tax=Dethiobacter alkaliphilus AHT 1 TaxID=555088 RepID=C0GFJ2_DETAL|nr:hypothetical protein [Dethiobacter alkaliphilus]EEG77952.1 hypothetical protein DealDRAFT_1251 [Dethiobacter alkaliphilus AHT 1]
MESIGLFLIIAVLAGSVWECLKGVLPWNVPDHVDRLAVIIIAVFITVAAGTKGAETDLFKEYGLPMPYYTGYMFTGVICSKGANYLHDLVTNRFRGRVIDG